ncbi:MAG: hypothetical protein ACI835_003730, partial [Planctomycetota bacterium]
GVVAPLTWGAKREVMSNIREVRKYRAITK